MNRSMPYLSEQYGYAFNFSGSAIGSDRYRVLLVKVPPPPEPEGPQLRADLTTQGIPLFAVDIPRLKAFEKAAAAGVPVYDVKDANATRAWKAYQAVGKELLTYAGGK